MRVISGKFRGKRLYSPEGDKVRPTTDKIKETLFNILASKLTFDDVQALDLFGGTGGIGIEILSRGAKKVIFIDKERDSFRLIKQNLLHVNADAQSYELYNVDYEFALKKLAGKKFDLIIADPPYGNGYEDKIVSLVKKYDLLNSGGVLVVEHSTQKSFGDYGFSVSHRKCGNTTLSFLSLEEVEQ